MSLRHPELLAGGAHLVLEELAQRLDELEVHLLGQAAHVVVALDDRARPLERDALDDVRVERALHEPLARRAPSAASSSKTSMKTRPMILRFCSGSVTPRAPSRKRSRASTATRFRWKLSRNVATTCSASPCAEQAVVDEDAREPVAERLVAEDRGDRRVDAAREAAERRGRRRATVARTRGDGLLGERARRPRRARGPRRRRGTPRGRPRRAACARPRGGTGRRRCACSRCRRRRTACCR